jgi:hypothetical protein
VKRLYPIGGPPVDAGTIERAMADEAPAAIRAPEVMVREQPGDAPARMS